MKKYGFIQKVAFRSADGRIIWAQVVCENDGLALLTIQAPQDNAPHSIVIAQEGGDRVYEAVNVNRFPLRSEDMIELGKKLHFMGKWLLGDELARMGRPEELPGGEEP